MLALLRTVVANRDLRRLQFAWAASTISSFAYVVGLAVISYRTAGTTGVGVLMAARMVVAAIASPLTASLADSRPARAVMAGSDLARAVLLLMLAAAAQRGSAWAVLLVLAATVAVAVTPFRPAQAALLPALAGTPEELTASNAIASTVESVGVFAGPAVGGLLLAAGSPAAVFLFCAGLAVVSAALVVTVREPARDRSEGGDHDQGGHRLTAGIRLLASSRDLAAVVSVYAVQALAAGALGVYIVVVAIDLLHTGNAGVGYLDAAIGVGGVLGGVAAAGLATGGRVALAFGGGVAIWGVGMALVAASSSTAVTLSLLAVVGIGNTIVDVGAVTLLQRSAPEAVLGRVFGALESILLAALGVGAIAGPALIAALSVRGALVVTGLALPLSAVVVWRRLARLDRVPAELEQRIALLAASPIFAPLARPMLEQLARRLKPLRVAAGDVVVRRGDPGDRFYVVAAGELSVDTGSGPAPPLRAGDVFGEIALLHDVPRTATITARAACDLLALDRGEFLAAVTGNPRSAAEADMIASARLGSLRPSVSAI
ncbi:MAG TPA: MFS transporter [Gaiellales bacterium]|nr:MFS transporter [Gaiellales bacterium]